MRYVLSVAVKLFVMQLVVNIGFAMLSLNDLDASIGSTLDAVKFSDLFFLIGKALILLALAKVLPDTCAGIISGSSIGGGNPLIAAGRSAAAVAAGAVSGGAAAAAMTAASHTIAKGDPAAGGQGAKGFMETAGAMAKNMWGARQESSIAKNPNSMANQLKSQANAVKALSSGSGGGASAPTPSSNATPQEPKPGFFSGPVDMRTPPVMPSAQDAPAASAPTPPSLNKDEIND
jgi:type IV secretory pathway TrbL component